MTGLLDAPVAGDGSFGPVTLSSSYPLEFRLECADRPPTHIYRTPVRRSTRYLRIRPMTLALMEQMEQPVVVVRSNAYIGELRDKVAINGRKPEALPLGVNRYIAQGGDVPSTVARVTSVQLHAGMDIHVTLNDQQLSFPLPASSSGVRPVTVVEFD